MEKIRFTGETVAYVSNSSICKKIILGIEETEKNLKTLKKKLGNVLDYTRISSDFFNFSVKIKHLIDEDNLLVFVKSDKLPTQDWYKVKNLDDRCLGKIITECGNICKGEVLSSKFEVCVEGDFSSGEVFLVSNEMEELYRSSREEMRRILSIQFGKKTRKLIPGYRYDTENTSRVFLGEFYTRFFPKSDTINTSTNPSSLKTVYLFADYHDLENKLSRINNVSEAIKEGFIYQSAYKGEVCLINSLPLYLEWSKSSKVSVGKVLEDDLVGDMDFSVYYVSLIKNGIDEMRNPYNLSNKLAEKPYIYDDMGGFLFNTLVLNRSTDSYDKIMPLAEEVLRGVIKDATLSSIRFSENLKGIKNLPRKDIILRMVSSRMSNCYVDLGPNEIREFLVEFLQVDRLIDEVLKQSRDVLNIWADFYVLQENFELIRRTGDITYLSLRTSASTTNSGISNLSISKIINKGYHLRDKIIKITESVKDGTCEYSLEALSYSNCNAGTTKTPKYYKCITIYPETLIDKVYGGIDNVPEEVKEDILDNKFTGIHISFDSESKIE